MSEQKNLLILALALVVAALIIVVGVNFAAMNATKNNSNPTIQLPNYLQATAKQGNIGISPGNDVVSFAADETGKTRLISVSGTITKAIAPDQATVVLSVQTLDKSATKSQSDNADLSDKVRTALKASGLQDSAIKTVSYNLQEEFQWNDTIKKSESVGYRTTNSIQLTLTDIASTGKIIDAAVQAGANSVSNVSFGLSTAKEAEVRTMALQEAAANAKTKAQNIASGLGISVGQVYSASESSNYYYPMYERNYALGAADSTAKATTPISAGDIEFTANVSVQFEIQ